MMLERGSQVLIALTFVMLADVMTSYCQTYLAAAEENNKWGFIDTTGNWVIEPRFHSAEFSFERYYYEHDKLTLISEFSEGRASFRENMLWGFIDVSGEVVIPAGYGFVDYFHNGRCLVEDAGFYYFINYIGEVIAGPYDDAHSFVNGLAAVSVDRKWGVIDTSGNPIIPTKFEEITDFADGRFFGKLDGKWSLFSLEKQLEMDIEPTSVTSFKEGKAAIRIKGKWGFLDTSGITLIEPQFDKVYPFVNAVARGRKSKQWHYVYSANMVVSRGYQNVEEYSEGYGRVRLDHQWYYVDMNGQFLFTKPLYKIYSFSQGAAKIRFSELHPYVFIDTSGKLIGPHLFEEARDFTHGRAMVKMDGKWGFINRDGNVTIPCKFDNVRGFLRAD